MAAEGKRSSREISTAVVFSGLMAMSIFRFRRRSATLLVYSWLRMRAMVCPVPRSLAVRQHTIFTSSELVAATSRSALPAPASRRVAAETPLPCIAIMSSWSLARRRASPSVSTMVTSCSSLTSCSARVNPTLPLPAMIMFMVI